MADQLNRLTAALGDRYRIDREVGAGGMAVVYLATDLKHDRRVALKVLRPEVAATLGPDRFPREIKIVAKLQHPHILPLHDSGETQGFLYYVMPFVEGESLRTRLERDGALPVSDALRIFREVVDALAAAHADGIVHRDIKPDNVMLSGRHAVVTDFGVAKAVSASGGEKLTTVGVAVGTPMYMAPEQAMGESHIDHRADIYAVGVLAYEMLTGKPPFDHKTSQAVLSAHVLEKPVDVREKRASVPAPVAEVVMRCLAKNPADRWQSAEDILQHLEAVPATPSGGMTPTDTRPVKVTPARLGWPRWLVPAGAAGVVALAAAGAWLAFGRGGGQRIDHIAVLPIQDISGSDAQFFDAMHDQLIVSLGQAGGLTVTPRSAMMIYRSEPKPMGELARELHVGAILEGTVFRTGERMRINVQLVEPHSIQQLWGHSYEIDVRDVLSAQDSVVRQIAAGVRRVVVEPAPSTPSR